MALIRTEDARFTRDTQSMALLNTDRAALQQYRAMREKTHHHEQLRQDVQSLQTQLHQLTELVQTLIASTTRS